MEVKTKFKESWARFEDIAYRAKKIAISRPDLAKDSYAESMIFLIDMVYRMKERLGSAEQINHSLKVHNDLLKERIKAMES